MVVIIYQSGSSPCLRYCIESLRVHSARSRVIVIGDDVKNLPAGCDFVSEQPFLETYNRFLPTYEHHSPNPPEFELLCLRRWMVIAEYVRAAGIQEFVCFDSDVIFFCDLNDTLQSSAEFSLYSEHVGAFVWVRGNGLDSLVSTILEVYADKGGDAWKGMLSQLESGAKPSISDMGMVEHVMTMTQPAPLGLCSPHGKQAIFDRNICATFDFMVQGDRKRLFFMDGYPYAVTANGYVVKMNTIHCWGPYKKRMDAVWQLSRTSVGKLEPVPWK